METKKEQDEGALAVLHGDPSAERAGDTFPAMEFEPALEKVFRVHEELLKKLAE